jgi:hypothetical protein
MGDSVDKVTLLKLDRTSKWCAQIDDALHTRCMTWFLPLEIVEIKMKGMSQNITF